MPENTIFQQPLYGRQKQNSGHVNCQLHVRNLKIQDPYLLNMASSYSLMAKDGCRFDGGDVEGMEGGV